ncbi:AI-2E family transporter [Candidatus Woesearchaeota archaeon]|nr:AI-2E family transporter [Candidatus Woesearchaeota archaeon]
MRTLNTNYKVWLSMVLLFIILLALAAAVWYLRNVFRHVLVALIIIYVLSPFATYLMRFGIRKSQAFAVVFLGLAVIILSVVLFVGPTVAHEVETAKETWPAVEQRVSEQIFSRVYQDGELVAYYIPKIGMQVEAGKVQGVFFNLLGQVKAFISSLLPALISSLIIVPIMTIVLIKDRERIYRAFFNLVPNRYFEVVMSMAHEINSSVENFISAKAIQSIIVGAVCTIGFVIIGVKVPILMGVLVGLFNIIPYIGPLIGAAPPIIISYLLLDTRTAVLAAIIIIIAQGIDNLFTQPVLLPKLVNEHPLAVILVTLIGAELFGALGLVFAIAVYSIVKIIFVKSYDALDVLHSREKAQKT